MSAWPTQAEAFLAEHERRLRPLRRAHGEAYWRLATTSSPEASAEVERLEGLVSDHHADPELYARLRGWLERREELSGDCARQLEVLLPDFREAQVPKSLREELIRRALGVEERYAAFRPLLRGRPVHNNEIDRVLLQEEDPTLREEAWRASRAIGALVRDDVRALARLRNEQARALGCRSYFQLALEQQGIDEQWLLSLFARLRSETQGTWTRIRNELGEEARRRFRADASDLRPWHFTDRFLQNAPRYEPGSRSLDHWFTTPLIQRITRRSFGALGLPIDGIWERSDLFPRDGKLPHAFCIGIDNPHDVRVLCNIDGSARWMETMLHEFGHAVYDAGIDPELPFALREPAHTFLTEGVAMWFGRRVKSSPWLQAEAGVPTDLAEAAEREMREQQIIFARWVLVVCGFERAMYEDPEQDLDTLWWALVEDLQGIARPPGWEGGDWAAKIHVACYPAYYQNYLLGELFASQVESAVAALPREARGAFLQRLFRLGRRQPWPQAVAESIGAPFSADPFLQAFGDRAP